MKKISLYIIFLLLLVFSVGFVNPSAGVVLAQDEAMEQEEDVESDSMMEDSEDGDMEMESEPEKVNSFELFWPIVAGKVKGESLYFLKSFKETIREMLIFSSFKKADYNLTLSEKRTVEAEELIVKRGDLENGRKTLEEAQAKREKALDLIMQAEEDGRYVTDLKNALKSSLEKQRALMNYNASQVEGEARSALESNIDSLHSVLSHLE